MDFNKSPVSISDTVPTTIRPIVAFQKAESFEGEVMRRFLNQEVKEESVYVFAKTETLS